MISSHLWLKLRDFVFSILLIITMLFPSSINGNQSAQLVMIQFMLAMSLIIVFFLSFCRISKFSLLCSFVILSLYLLFTLSSEYTDYAIGHALAVLPILILTTLRIKSSLGIKPLIRVYYLITLVVFILAYSHFYSPLLSDLMLKFYAGGYDGLASNFKERLIPVSIFVSHSYAAFFYFTILFVSWFLFSNGVNRLLNLLIVVLSLISTFLLLSGSGYFFVLYSFIFMFSTLILKKSKNYLFLTMKVVFSFLVLFLILLYGVQIIPDLVERIIGDSGNGLLSRYVDGVLKENVNYIANNPVVGLGFSFSDNYYYTDSDYIVMALRLGLIGSLLFFLTIFLFLNFNLNITLIFKLFFVFSIFIFMVSMPLSLYQRAVPFFIFFILFFRSFNDKLNSRFDRAIK